MKHLTAAARLCTTLGVLAAVSLLSSCREAGMPLVPLDDDAPPTVTPPHAQNGSVQCAVDLRRRTLSCPDATAPGGFPTVQANGTSTDRIIGGQGLYVRLASSNVTYVGTTFTFDVTVQNLTTLSMATADGATPHDDGVMVFVSSGPTTTAGTGDVTVNGDGVDSFLDTDQPFYRYGGIAGAQLGGDGMLISDETSAVREWNFTVPNTVDAFTFEVFVATHMSTAPLLTIAPQIESLSVTPLVPGSAVTLTGTNFDAAFASNTVTIGGIPATVTGGTTTTLNVTVPCVGSGTAGVQVSTGGRTGAVVNATVAVPQTTLAAGEKVIITDAAGLDCIELAAAGGEAEYIVSVFSAATTTTANADFALSADGAAVAGLPRAQAAPVPDGVVAFDNARLPSAMQRALREQEVADEQHNFMLEQNRIQYERLMAQYPGDRARMPAISAAADPVEPPTTRLFRIINRSPPEGESICSSYYVISATRIYYDGRLAIYEDDSTPDEYKSALNAEMALNYQRIGDQFNADMDPIITAHFGDVLLRDAITDNNGVLVALFTPHINNLAPGVAGFVVSCDQFPNTDTNDPGVGGPYTSSPGGNGSSNFGEFFYAYQPAGATTPEWWYRTIRSTFIHETKHVASHAARVANGAPVFEQSWLEEGTARHSEELWMRKAVDNVAWKDNTGYGSAGSPINIYCDVRDGLPCTLNVRRPAYIMVRHFSSLYTHLFAHNARLLSPFGRTASDNASYFYAIAWSLVRYAIDRYAGTEEAFFTALNQSLTNGVTNLTAAAGVGIEQLLGEWNLALAVDDHPDIGAPDPATQVPTWDFRNIYAGLNVDFPGTYTLPYPQAPTSYDFGSFTAPDITTLRGGGSIWYRVTGTQTAPQLLRLGGASGAARHPDVRMAIVRVK